MAIAQDDRLCTRIIREETEWNAIRANWDALLAASPSASTPLDFVWLRTWWRIYGPTYGEDGLRIITLWRGSRLAGALPLYLSRRPRGPLGVRSLRFVSTGEAEGEETCPDYLNLLYLPGEQAVCVASAWETVGQLAWDRLELRDMPASSPLIDDRAIPAGSRRIDSGRCPIAELEGGLDAYLGRLSSRSRQHARRLIREGERAGVGFEIVEPDRATDALDELIHLHQRRWVAVGKPGVFAAPRFSEFHRELVHQWLPVGRAVLARLALGPEPQALLYGFRTGSKFDFYQSGVRHERNGPLRSPGNLAHLLLMRVLAGRGVAKYDFLRGSSSYKERLATRADTLVRLQAWRPTLPAVVHRTIRLAGRVSSKALRLVKERG
jgi:CelD/BcsL family acetyltransferase involved in cellulose biosynthesis